MEALEIVSGAEPGLKREPAGVAVVDGARSRAGGEKVADGDAAGQFVERGNDRGTHAGGASEVILARGLEYECGFAEAGGDARACCWGLIAG